MRIVPVSLAFILFCAAASSCIHAERPTAHLAKRESLPPRTDRNQPTVDAALQQDGSSTDGQTDATPLPTCGPGHRRQIRHWVRPSDQKKMVIEAWCEKPVGVRDGPYMEWWTEDIKSQVGTYKDGKKRGKWTTFHPNGKIASEGHYDEAGKRHGLWRWWWWFSKDKTKQPPMQDVGQFSHGRAVGRWKSWNYDGKPILRQTNAVIIGSVGGRIELYINGGEPELFQAALNVLRRLTPKQRKAIQSDPKFEAALEEMRATDGAGIEPEEINALRRALKYRE